MALRDKLRERVTPQLEPGENLEQVFLAQTGPNPMWVILTYLVFFKNKYYIVAVTDRAVVFFRASFWRPSFVKAGEPPQRLPRNAKFGPISGLWASSSILGGKLWIAKRFHADARAADGTV